MSATPSKPEIEDDAWRTRLLASLRDCGVQRVRGWRWARWTLSMAVVVGLILITAIGQIALRQLESRADDSDELAMIGIATIWFVAVSFVLLRARNWFLRRAWQYSARSAEEELARPKCRRPILYLRSFGLDQRIGQMSWYEFLVGTYPLANAEQQLTKALRTVGPVIAIGRPDEKLPALGAARFYVSDDRWQSKVADVAAESQYVILATGATDGLKWEFAHAIERVPPTRLILWLHPSLLKLSEEDRETEWKRFREALGSMFPKQLPEKLGDARFVFFAGDWEPIAVAPQRQYFPWGNPVSRAIRPTLKALRGEISPMSISYPGPNPDETFAGVVGLEQGPMPGGYDWRRVGAFFVACLLLQSRALLGGFFSWPLIFAVTLTISVLLCFRLMRGAWATFSAATAFAVAIQFYFVVVRPAIDRIALGRDFYGHRADDFVVASFYSFVGVSLTLAILDWGMRRLRPRVLVFSLAALAYMLVGWLQWAHELRRGTPLPDPTVFRIALSVVGPIVFVLCLESAVRLTSPLRTRNPQKKSAVATA